VKRYSAANARQHLSDVLDEAEAGEAVVIERRGVRFTVVAQLRKKKPLRHRRLFDWVDPLILSGNWTWAWTPEGVELVPQEARKSTKK
jgi:prevent-host-death family protein